jgi:sigma-E factor negative regulatory protein RseB
MKRRHTKWLAASLLAAQSFLPAQAADPLANKEAAAFLQRMSDAARRIAYEGVFVVQHGTAIQTLSIENRPIGANKESRLAAMDGVQREVRCSINGSVSQVTQGGQIKLEKRLNNRHFPDLLPANAALLANWYGVKLGDFARVAGLECRQVELIPKDEFRWGYLLCADKDSGLPLKAAMINESGQPLMQYAFAEVRIGGTPRIAAQSKTAHPILPASTRPIEAESIVLKSLPPGFTRVTAIKRTLPNKTGEVEHWVFSDGLTHISLFLEPAAQPVESVRGQSKQGMINLAKRQVGQMQATVIGDAPWAAIEAITMGLEPRRIAP